MSLPGVIGSNGMIPVPWREYIGKSPGCTSTSSFAFGGGTQSALNIDINFADTSAAISAILGSSVANGAISGQPAILSRALPAQHPEFTQLYATRIAHVQGISFQTKQKGTGFGGGFYSVYRWRRLTVVFEAPRYAVLSDSQMQPGGAGGSVLPEFMRFTYPEFDFSSEALERQDGEFKYAEGPGTGSPVVSGQSQYLNKVGFVLNWMFLPELGLFDQQGRATNFLNCMNKVNSVPFMNYPTGTLLFMPPKLEPLATPYLLSSATFPTPGRYWNAKVFLKWFDPTLGTGATTRGWNTAPFPGDGGRWAKIVQRDGSGRSLYETADFATAFQMNIIN